jgi:hypothetical protein
MVRMLKVYFSTYLALQSLVTAVRTVRCNFKKLSISLTQCMYVFRMILIIDSFHLPI